MEENSEERVTLIVAFNLEQGVISRGNFFLTLLVEDLDLILVGILSCL